jgi:hypothetical protein
MTSRLIAVVVLWATASGAYGQERRERILFSALDRTKKPVLGLRAEDFTLKVDGRVAPLEDFRPARPADGRSTPLVAWILLSAYRPISSRLIADQAAAAAGVFTLLHPESALGVQVISDRVETLAPLGNDPGALRRAFTDYGSRRIELRAGPSKDIVPIGQGGILAAIEHAMDSMDRYVAERRAQSGTDVHRAVIVVALPLVPSYYHFYPGREALLDHAARDGVFFYPIFVPRVSWPAGWNPTSSWRRRRPGWSRCSARCGRLSIGGPSGRRTTARTRSPRISFRSCATSTASTRSRRPGSPPALPGGSTSAAAARTSRSGCRGAGCLDRRGMADRVRA